MRAERSITLLELQEEIKSSIEARLESSYWIRGEISEIKYQSTGHCYMDLVDRREGESGISARAQAIVWSSVFRMLRPYFETTTGQELTRGMQILVQVQVQYSPLYGLSLVVSDIDPAFTVGEQELQRQQTIKRLREEGMFDMNSTLELALLPRRIAVISSAQAAGYRDFMKHLTNNEYGFTFRTELFQAAMQGATAPAEIISAMDAVAARAGEFDMLVIARGGGSVQDLICFDDYELAANIAQFPLPVITGIGHDHDIHVADMVAHTMVKTPTAAADFIIELFAREEQQLLYLMQRLRMTVQARISDENTRIEMLKRDIVRVVSDKFRIAEHRLELLQQRIRSANPLSLLEKGYSVTLSEGKRISSIKEIKEGMKVRIVLSDGALDCKVEKRSEL